MRYDITEPEQKFSSVFAGLGTLVLGAFEQYEADKRSLIEALKQSHAEKEELQERLDKALEDKA
jgi:hypothetical protein